jgi:hypothetical protein
MILCPDCKKLKAHYSMGKCHVCYNKDYIKTHPKQYKKIMLRNRKKYRTDEEYREKSLAWHKEYYKKNREKLLAYCKKYNKKHPRKGKIQRWKVGLLCVCGGIDKGVIHGRSNSHAYSSSHKCPYCGRYSEKKKVIFDRFTMKIVKTY